MSGLKQKLYNALNQLPDVAISPHQIEQLADYLTLLVKWNQAYNLTAIRDVDAMIPHHILDSLSVLPFLQEKRCLDVGTGPGLPGIPLAIMRPGCAFYLLDSNGKKTRFLQQVKHELGLENVTVIQDRIESYAPDIQFDTIISRAFASLKGFLQCTEHLRQPGTVLLAMKGPQAESEIEQVDDDGLKVVSHTFKVRGLSASRVIVSIKKSPPSKQ